MVKDINCGLIALDSGVKLLSAENLPKVIDVTFSTTIFLRHEILDILMNSLQSMSGHFSNQLSQVCFDYSLVHSRANPFTVLKYLEHCYRTACNEMHAMF